MRRADEIRERLLGIQARIEAACNRVQRSAGSVVLVGVTKTKPLEDVLAAYEAGLRHFGENRVQEAEEKFPHLPGDATRHLIGPLQSNKVNRAVKLFRVVETVDSQKLGERLSRAAEAIGISLAVYVEVNTGGEESKAGVSPEETPALVAALSGLPGLTVEGLMTIPPPGDTRPYFVRLRALSESLGLSGLSMGMSDDFEIAIEEGATIVRVGTAIFGHR
ncbi:MAG: YggS family pyridoxal phosphate-dependent enzyme [Acidobacteria bacterium]|nr:YggS family pyridoxal phosphate-dependent enzyme [Acidobacteriota bacterium]